MFLKSSELKNILIEPGYLSEENFLLAEKEAKSKNISIEKSIVNLGFLRDEELGQLIALYLKVNFINLRQEKINEKILKKIPEIVARRKKIIVFKEEKENIFVAFLNPFDLELIHFLETRFQKRIKIYLMTNDDFFEALRFYKGDLREELKNIFEVDNVPDD